MSESFLKEMLQDIREDVRDLRASHSKQNEAMGKLEMKVNELNEVLGFQKKKGCSTYLEQPSQGQRLLQVH